MRQTPIDNWVVKPLTRFIHNSTTSGIVLFFSAILALLLANSPWGEDYHHFWEHTFSIGYDEFVISKSLHHWINDGLMSVFFFVIGLELKREILAGELSKPQNAVLPIMAGIGGMIVPALFYLWLNPTGYVNDGWGIPMATDIAFALGILYLLGDKVPTSLKIFLTALAIADDLGAVLIIALFYTSDISLFSLCIGSVFMLILVAANLLGVRSTVFYGIVGIGGLWLAFLLSGVHATVAGVLAALTIPANVKIDDNSYIVRLRKLAEEFEKAAKNNVSIISKEQLHILDKIRHYSKEAMTPLQRLEHGMHPLVAFIVMPIFAVANAGITFSEDFFSHIGGTVSLGIISGLVLGKFIGIVGMTKVLVKLGWAQLPNGTTWRHIYGTALLAGIGFTMSLFITELAFNDPEDIVQAKIGILTASLTAGIAGYWVLSRR